MGVYQGIEEVEAYEGIEVLNSYEGSGGYGFIFFLHISGSSKTS